jgi:hypothetical protein
MDSELWRLIYHTALDVSKEFFRRGVRHSDRVIVLTYVWAALHDRPVSWACRTAHWPGREQWAALPSPATLSRRLRTASAWNFFVALHRRLSPPLGPQWCRWIDARPLPIGGSSQDGDARVGRAAGIMAKGYKLHAVYRANGTVEAWQVWAMNVNEKTAAPELLPQLAGPGYLVGDNQYDANPLFDLAAAHGQQLVSPRRADTALGHQPHSVYRRRSDELLHGHFGQALLKQRFDIDRLFGQMSNFGGGLSPLPNWVRTMRRVRLWVHAKLIIHAAWRLQKQRLKA